MREQITGMPAVLVIETSQGKTLEHYGPDEGIRPPEWMDDAACKELQPNVFVAMEAVTDPARLEVMQAIAKVVCDSCDVRVRCLKFATDNDLPGFKASTTQAERQELAQTLSDLHALR